MIDWFGAPEMFLNYGIVSDDMPQLFLFDFARVKFELDHGADGEVEVRFLLPPSEKGIGLLKGQLSRLVGFASERQNRDRRGGRSARPIAAGEQDGDRDDRKDISDYEWDMIWRYHTMLRGAISLAIDGSVGVEKTDEVWSMDEDWWVQDGETTMADDYAHIYRTLPHHLASGTDEL